MATQKGRNWSSGDIVTAANLSSIERGVSTLAEEYTPTTWVNGDTVTAVALNNIEQGIANAGGGSSDFSTASMGIFFAGNDAFLAFNGQTYKEELSVMSVDALLLDSETGEYLIDKEFDNPTTTTVSIVMIKPSFTMSFFGDVVVTGNASVISEDGAILITGDCTITISDSSGGQVVD